jgi:hypothetical protein
MRRILYPWFYIYECTAQWTVALKRSIFKRKKGFANLNLGLIYNSIASSQPPSRDTVPLSHVLQADITTPYILQAKVAIHDIVALTYYLENFDKSVINPDSLLIQVIVRTKYPTKSDI